MRKFTTALFAATLMAGCSSTPKADSELELAQKSPHLAAIPAETPYALASLQPMPMGEMVDMLGQLGTAMDALSGQMAATLTPQSSTPERFVVAYLEEFRGKWNREGLESLGFSMSPRTAVYGISWLPVFRYETKDPEAMKGLIQRIETRAGLTSTEQKIGEYSYKAYAADDAVFALSFQGNELVMGFTPTSTAELYLPYLVGEKKPADNILKSRALEVLTEKYGFKPYFLGFVDIERIVQMLVAPQPGLNEDIAARLSPDRDLSMSPVCQSEVRALAAKYPRMVMGYDEWTATQFSARGGLEMTNGLGTKLAKTRTSIPASNSTYAKDAMAAFGAGVDMGALIQVAAEMANAHRETPFQCDQLAEFNQAAEQFGAVSMMIPPVISQLQGVNVIVKNIKAPADGPQAPQGDLAAAPTSDYTAAVVIRTSNAVALMDFLKMTAPELANLAIKPDSVAVAVPDLASMGVPPGNYFLSMTPNQIGIAAGQTAADDVVELANAAPTETPWITFSYDAVRLIDALGGAPELEGMSKMFLGPVQMEVIPNDSGVFFKYQQQFAQ